MNAKEYVDEVSLRLSRLDVSLELDASTVLTFVNRARREVQMTTIGLYGERYGRVTYLEPPYTVYSPHSNKIEVANPVVTGYQTPVKVFSTPLPSDILDITNVVYNVGKFRYQMRRVDKRELFGVQMQSWNRPTQTSPVFALERNPKSAPSTAGSTGTNSVQAGQTYIVSAGSITYNGTTYNAGQSFTVPQGATGTALNTTGTGGFRTAVAATSPLLIVGGISGGEAQVPQVPPDGTAPINVAHNIEVWYTYAIPAIEIHPNGSTSAAPDEEIHIPWQFQELVVVNAIVDCLQRTNFQQAYQSAKAELDMLLQLIPDTYKTQKAKAGSLLPSRQGIM